MKRRDSKVQKPHPGKPISPGRMEALLRERMATIPWVVFEPLGPTVWADARSHVEKFLCQLFRQGSLQGQTPEEAYFVKCDESTNTRADREMGCLNLEIGFAPRRPGEFIILRISVRVPGANGL